MVHSLLSRVHACIFRVFTKEQYFDSDGLFFSTVYSTPVLFNCLLLLVRVLSPPVLIYTYSMEPFYGSKYCPNVLTCFTNIQGKLQSWELHSCKFWILKPQKLFLLNLAESILFQQHLWNSFCAKIIFYMSCY